MNTYSYNSVKNVCIGIGIILKSLLVSLVLLFAFCSIEDSSFLPSDSDEINNPFIFGQVVTPENNPISNAMLIIGPSENNGELDSIATDNSVKYTATGIGAFDTVYSDYYGYYTFEDIDPGDYVIRGEESTLLGIETVNFTGEYSIDITLTLSESVPVKIHYDTGSVADSAEILTARIAGTDIFFEVVDESELELSSAPTGYIDIILYARDGTTYRLPNLLSQSGCEPYIIVDPMIPPEEWITGGCEPRDPTSAPVIIWSSPPPGASGSAARVNRDVYYDVAIQFSHPMDTRKTKNAVSVEASYPNCVRINDIEWQGSDVLFITLARKYPGSSYYYTSVPYRMGTEYRIIIDTTAQTGFGVAFKEPAVLSFTPEPKPRLTEISGFRFSASAENEKWDSLPPVITLGSDISPSVALATGNLIIVKVVGNIEESTLSKSIKCFVGENGNTIALETDIVNNNYYSDLHIIVPSLLKSSTNYEIVIDTSMHFVETGRGFDYAMSLIWETVDFTIDTALIMGQYKNNSIISVTTQSKCSLMSSSYRSQPASISPNLPITAFYASTPLDSAFIQENIVLPEFYSNTDIIIDSSYFGFRTEEWLNPGGKFIFKILPGLRSLAGDLLGDSLIYIVSTGNFELTQINAFGVVPDEDNYCNIPPQDTIYQIPVGYLKYYDTPIKAGPGYFDYIIHNYYTYVNFNAPVDSSEYCSKFTVNPKNGLNGIYRNTSFMYAAESSLIPDTIYTITLEEGLRDTFNDNATDEFKYTFKTEPFEMKVGNLFGVYFGKSPDTLNEFTPPGLPQQPLPGVTIIDNPTDPGPIIWTLESDIYYTTDGTSPDSILTSFADNAYIKVAPGSRTNTGISVTGKISTPIGVSASTYNPVFDHTMNFLAFSGIPDSTDYMNHVVIHPDDGTIHIKLDRNKLRFSADFWAKSNTEYSIKVLPTFHDIYGREIGDTVQVSFITPEFKLLNATINSTLCGDSIKAGHSFPYELHTSEFSMNINFSHPLDIASANENFDIIPSIKGQLTITTTNLHFNSTQRLIPDTQYTVIIGNGLKEQYGGKIDTTYSIKFRIEKFKLKSLAIGTAEEHSLFSLSTNSILDSTSLYGAVDIIPEKYSEGTYYLTDDSTGAYFIPDSTIVFGDEVTVTTDTTIKDIFGNECQNSLSINFLVNYLERLFKKRSN